MIKTYTLACGMPLIVETIPGVASVGMTWLVPAGSATDPAEREGLAPMIEELLFRGAGELDSRAQADAMDGLGVSRDTDVGPLYMKLSATLVGDKLEAAMPLFVDMVLKPRFDEVSIEPTRSLCVQSLEGLADNPQERAGLVLRERHLPPPLNRTGLGTIEGLEAITREDVVDHWKTWARPQRSILAIAGAADGDVVARQLDALLRGWSGTSAEVALKPSTTAGTYHHEQDESNQVHIYLAHEAPAERDADSAMERVLSGVLSGGPSARLFTEVREKRGLCYSVSAAYAADKTFGRMIAYVGTTPDKAQQSLDVLCEQLRLVTASGGGAMGITEDEFQRAVVGAKSSLVFSGESTSARAAALASDQHRLGRARSLQEIAETIDAVTLNALRAYVARRKPSVPTVVTLGPVGLVMPGW